MLLDNLLKASVVQLGESAKIMHIGNDITQILIQQHEVFFQGGIWLPFVLLCLRNDIVDLLLASLDPLHNLLALHLLECIDLVELSLQLPDEALLIVFSPVFPLGLGILLCRLGNVVGL